MWKRKASIIALGVVVVLIIVGVLYKKSQNSKSIVSDVVFGLEWGTSKEKVESIMLDVGGIKREGTLKRTFYYDIEDFQGMEGINCIAVVYYDEELKLNQIVLFLEADNDENVSSVLKLKNDYETKFNDYFSQKVDMIPLGMTYDKYEYNVNWWDDETVITMTYDIEDRLSIMYSDATYESGFIAELESLKKNK